MNTVDNFHITTEVTQNVTRFLAFIFSQFLFAILAGIEISWSRKIHCDFISVLLYLVLFSILILFISKKNLSLFYYIFLLYSLCPVFPYLIGYSFRILPSYIIGYIPFFARLSLFRKIPLKNASRKSSHDVRI